MTLHIHQGHTAPRRLRAAIIGLGLDGPLRPTRIVQSEECLLIGGSDSTHDALIEIMLRLESELDRMGRTLGELDPSELLDLAQRIDSPELELIAEQMEMGLRKSGRLFHESSPEELTALATLYA